MTRLPNPDMMLIAREIRGLTQTDLAKLSGIGQGRLSRHENGEQLLSNDDLHEVARALDFPVSFFYRRGKRYGVDTGTLFHRQRHSLPATDQKRLDSQLDKYRLDVEELLRNINSYDIAYPIPQYEVGEQGAEAAAASVRDLWEIRPGPIDNLVERLEIASCFIFYYDFGTEKMDEATRWIPPMPPVIMVNSRTPGDRLRFSLAHALGHLIMHQNRLPYEGIEGEADRFASALLMPAEDIRPELQPVTIDHMLHLKKKWKVSMQALIRRARDIGEISETRYTSLFQMLSRYGYRKNEPVEIPPEKPTLVKELLNLYKKERGYTNEELATLTTMHLKDFHAMYYPEVRLAGQIPAIESPER